jgi:cell division septation protein DedD
VSFGSYASAGDADKVIGALRSAELPAYRELATVAGRQAHRVRIGPFADRAMAESARLRAAHVRDDVDARVIALDAGNPSAPTAASTATPAPSPSVAKPVALPPPPKPAAPAPTVLPPAPVASTSPPPPSPVPAPAPAPAPAPVADTSGTGFVVQVGAFADAAGATALRDRLRGAGFNAFTDAVDTEAGRRTRVRVGPTVTRAEAEALKAQVKARAGIDGIVRPHP